MYRAGRMATAARIAAGQEGDRLEGVEPALVDDVEAGVPDLGQDPGQEEAVDHGHRDRDQDRLDDQAIPEGQVRAPGRPRHDPVEDIERADPPGDRGPARMGPSAGRAGRRGAGLARALGLDRCPEDQDRRHDQERQVIGEPRHVAQRGQCRQHPLLGRQLAQPARPGQLDQVPAAGLGHVRRLLSRRKTSDCAPVHETTVNPIRAATIRPARRSRRKPSRTRRICPGMSKSCPNALSRPLRDQDHGEQHRQTGQQGQESVQVGGRPRRAERQAPAPSPQGQQADRVGVRGPRLGLGPDRQPRHQIHRRRAPRIVSLTSPSVKPSGPSTAARAAGLGTDRRPRFPTFDDCTRPSNERQRRVRPSIGRREDRRRSHARRLIAAEKTRRQGSRGR